MTFFRVAVNLFGFIASILLGSETLFAGQSSSGRQLAIEELEAPKWEVSAESAYLLGFFDNPHGYEIGAQFITARMRLGPVRGHNWLRGYHQAYFSAIVEPIFRGPENYYFGFSMGLRYNFVPPGSRFRPYISGGVGAGAIDSQPDSRGAQGQDFTFNILSAAGVSYHLNDRWKVDAGILYQHLSNAGQTSPNPSLNLLGPQIGATYSF
jgi:opacity protein-like surface antigen